nr:nickel insertion protein [Halobacteroides halobius]
MMLETNIDDMNPEIYSYLFPKLFETGALDVYLTNIMMKKNRPGVKVNVLCQLEDTSQLEEIIFRETTTLGIRKYEVERKALKRKFYQLETLFGEITIKVAYYQGELIKYAPEYEECKKIAQSLEVPVKKVYNQALVTAKEELTDD